MDIINFIFRNFWTFIGTIVLIYTVCRGIAGIILAFWGKRSTDEFNVIKVTNTEVK